MATPTITVYTTYNDIRAALGVSTDDIEDTALALATYADLLDVELTDIDSTVPASFASISLIVTPTAAETKFLQATRLFATYALAKSMSSSLPLFAAKQLSDGKTTNTRFESPYRDTIKAIAEQYARFKTRLAAATTAIGTTTTTARPLVFFTSVAPSVDVVTNT